MYTRSASSATSLDFLRKMAFDLAAAAAAVPWSYLLYGLTGSALLWQARLLLDRLWWRPRRLERTLRAQGVRGTPYRFLMGDLKDFGRLNDEAWSKPLPVRCHDIVPRVIPFLHNNVRDNGKPCFSWFGPVANVAFTDPELIKDVLSNKFGHFEKPQFPALTKLLANGLTTHEGEKWVKHRRILNPAFHLEKLKVSEKNCTQFRQISFQFVWYLKFIYVIFKFRFNFNFKKIIRT